MAHAKRSGVLREEELRKYSAELLGTFALVFIGCGSAVIAGRYIGNTGVSFAFGLTLLAMVYAIGNVSGCHINPAVTVGMLAAGRTTKRDALFYIIAQCVGGILAALVLWGIASGLNGYSLASDGLAQNGYGDHSPAGYSLAACFFAEVVLTAIFLFVILGATSKRAPAGSAGLAIGLTLVFVHLVGIPVTNTSVNPARSLGPAIVVRGDAISQVWMFLIAPVIGAVIAAVVWKAVFERETVAAPK